MIDFVLKAALAGLTHDIGKVIQRGREDPWKMPMDSSEEGQPVHAAWSMQFASDVPANFRQPILMGSYHHRPEKNPAEDPHLSYLVALADKLSAGERSDKPEEKQQYPQQLVSIFDRIFLDQLESQEFHYLPLKPLKLAEDHLFSSRETNANTQAAYQALAGNLVEAAKKDFSNIEDYLENFLSMMQQNTWCVPSAYYHAIPDVSLYDHSRMTAALAACLAEQPLEEVKQRLAAVERVFHHKATPQDINFLAEPAVLLVGGDLSGIQDFIYTISARGAAKTLRGRSFYLQLLTEGVLRYILQQLQLPYSNVIYSSGGHFFLLAPLSAEPLLKQIREQITKKLIRHHGTSLYFALAHAPIPYNGFQKGQLPKHWNEMHRQLTLKKQRRYVELEKDLYDLVFAPRKHAGNQEDHCVVCGEQRINTSPIEDDEEGGRICSLCSSFETQLGKFLPETQVIALGIGTPQEKQPQTALDALAEFGLYVRLVNKANNTLDFNEDPVQRVILWELSDHENRTKVPGITPIKWKHYAVNQVPKKDFNQLQKDSIGIERLGVLRMDMDNLGTVFQTGFGKDPGSSIATLSRLSTLSFQISIFFEGWVKKIIESQEFKDSAGKPLIYAVYAGGDDLFLIGPWNLIPTLAQNIQQDFSRYVNHHPACHISAGMAFIHGKYPLYQAANDAGESLDQAKALNGKSAFAFLQRPWKWDDFSQIEEKQKILVHLTKALNGPKSILQLLQQMATAEIESQQKHAQDRVWGPWMWRGNYMFTRILEQEGDSQRKEIITKIFTDLKTNLYTDLQQWGVAARWAQLYIRDQDA